jgi:hypothetical protein
MDNNKNKTYHPAAFDNESLRRQGVEIHGHGGSGEYEPIVDAIAEYTLESVTVWRQFG